MVFRRTRPLERKKGPQVSAWKQLQVMRSFDSTKGQRLSRSKRVAIAAQKAAVTPLTASNIIDDLKNRKWRKVLSELAEWDFEDRLIEVFNGFIN